MKKPTILLFSLLMAVSFAFGQGESLPQNPTPGHCYIRCVTPEQYGTTEKRMLARPAYKRLEKTPAEYKTVEETVMVKPATKRYVYVPAEFKTVTQEIQIEEPYNEITIIPAKLGTTSETIESRPKVARWEYQNSIENCKSNDPRDCMVLCYVEHPAEYRTINSQTVEKEASYTKTQKGGKMMTLTRQELVKEARVEEVAIPAEYKTITKRVLVKDEGVREIEVPAEYNVETLTTLKDPGGVAVWEEIECTLTDYNVIPILYEFGSARLTSESRRIIDNKLLKLMRDKPNIRVELSSHTDSRGSAEANQKLSQARAESVVNYLVSRGIQRSRLVAKGYGESRPRNNCVDGVDCTEAQHQENRRTEFRVLSN
ncbi:MAG TPA: OmpA family protein [Bacteroidetes bacterium]|nr:OmpA family protein [Bacteroidota bacterium]